MKNHPTLLNSGLVLVWLLRVCHMVLDDVEQSLISIKHCLQHHPTFLFFSGMNNNVAFVSSP